MEICLDGVLKDIKHVFCVIKMSHLIHCIIRFAIWGIVAIYLWIIMVQNKQFSGKIKYIVAPWSFSRLDVFHQLEAMNFPPLGKTINILQWKRKRAYNDLNWVKKSIFFELPYWSSLRSDTNLMSCILRKIFVTIYYVHYWILKEKRKTLIKHVRI